jgi:hypothetical protein
VTLPAANGHVTTRSFDRAGRLTTVKHEKGASLLSRFEWTLDAAANPTKVRTSRGASDSFDAYEYDARNRLTAACFSVSAAATNHGHPPWTCREAIDVHDYTFTPLEGSGGRRGKVVGRGPCPEEGDYLLLANDGRESRYQVTFAEPHRNRPGTFVALVVLDP